MAPLMMAFLNTVAPPSIRPVPPYSKGTTSPAPNSPSATGTPPENTPLIGIGMAPSSRQRNVVLRAIVQEKRQCDAGRQRNVALRAIGQEKWNLNVSLRK